MSKIQYFLTTFGNYIISNNIIIDKAVYITLLVGELTISAIYLNFCQFIYSAGDKDEVSLFGEKPFDFYIRKEMSNKTVTIRRWIFMLVLAFQILYKPIVAIYGTGMPEMALSVMSFAWVTSVVAFFGFFAHLIMKCIVFTNSARIIFNKKADLVLYEMQLDFIKRNSKSFRKKPIKQLEILCDEICKYAKTDKEKQYKEYYFGAIRKLFLKYRDASQKSSWLADFIDKIKPYHRLEKFDNFRELKVLAALADEEYFWDYLSLQSFIICKLTQFIDENSNLFSSRSSEEPTVAVYHSEDYREQVEKVVDAIYKNNDVEVRKRLAEEYIVFNDRDFEVGFKACLGRKIISKALYDLNEDRIEEADFRKIYSNVRHDNKYNLYFSSQVFDSMRCGGISDNFVSGTTKLLDHENAFAVLLCLILFCACYKFRDEWKKMDIEALKKLYKNNEEYSDTKERTLALIKDSCFNHVFQKNPSMLDYLLDTQKSSVSGELIKDAYDKYPELAFYWIIVKMIVFDDYVSISSSGTDMHSLISFINELASHEELFKYYPIKNFINQFRTYYLICGIPIPEGLDYSFNTLTMLRADYLEIDFEKNPYARIDRSVGEYILMKLPDDINQIFAEHPEHIQAVQDSYMSRDCSVNKYIEGICKKAEALYWHVNHVGKERMKKNLETILAGKPAITPTPTAPKPTEEKTSKSLKKKKAD